MTFTFHEPTTTVLTPGNRGYHLIDGNKIVPRAMFGIKEQCPQSVRDTLNLAISRGWIVPIANVYNHEQEFNLLADKA